MELLAANLKAGTTRRAMLNGREHIVAPLTLIVPGVLNGSKGALLYPPEEISKNHADWNHTPIVVYHPTKNGVHVSARDPDVLDKQGIGIVMRSQAKGKLTAEGWFDVESTRRVDPRVLASLEAGQRIELSTGLYTDNEPATGTFNGKPYDSVARNYKPDHLAILPDQVGACSVRDGCGVLVNQAWQQVCCNVAAKPTIKTDKVRKKKPKITDDWEPLANCCGDSSMVDSNDDGSLLSTDAKVRQAFRELYPIQYDQDTGNTMPRPYVVAVFENHLICRDGETMRRHDWSLDDDGEVVIDNGFQEVERVTRYETVENATYPSTSEVVEAWESVENCGGKGGKPGPCPGKSRKKKGKKQKSGEINLHDYVKKGPKKFGTFTTKRKKLKIKSDEDTGSFSIRGRSGPMKLGIND